MGKRTSFQEVTRETEGPIQRSLPEIEETKDVTLSELMNICLEDPLIGQIIVIDPLRDYLERFGSKLYNQLTSRGGLEQVEEIWGGEVIVDLTYQEFKEKFEDIINDIQEGIDMGRIKGVTTPEGEGE